MDDGVHPYLSTTADIVRIINKKRQELVNHIDDCKRKTCLKEKLYQQMLDTLKITLEMKNQLENTKRLSYLMELANFTTQASPDDIASEKTFIGICSILHTYYYHYWLCIDITCQLCKTLPDRLRQVAESCNKEEHKSHLFELEDFAITTKSAINE